MERGCAVDGWASREIYVDWAREKQSGVWMPPGPREEEWNGSVDDGNSNGTVSRANECHL